MIRDLFVLSITGAESYVCETGKSMKAVVLAATQKGCLRNIAITLIDQRSKRVMAWLQQLSEKQHSAFWPDCLQIHARRHWLLLGGLSNRAALIRAPLHRLLKTGGGNLASHLLLSQLRSVARHYGHRLPDLLRKAVEKNSLSIWRDIEEE